MALEVDMVMEDCLAHSFPLWQPLNSSPCDLLPFDSSIFPVCLHSGPSILTEKILSTRNKTRHLKIWGNIIQCKEKNTRSFRGGNKFDVLSKYESRKRGEIREARGSLILLGALGHGEEFGFYSSCVWNHKGSVLGKGPTLAQVFKKLSGGLMENVVRGKL